MNLVSKAFHSRFWVTKYFRNKGSNQKNQPDSALLQSKTFNERPFYKAIEIFINTWK